jgi:hypothetical protein
VALGTASNAVGAANPELVHLIRGAARPRGHAGVARDSGGRAYAAVIDTLSGVMRAQGLGHLERPMRPRPALAWAGSRPMLPAMTRRSSSSLAAALALGLAGCGGPELADHAGQSPELELEEFLSGRLTAHGIFQDRFGDVRRTFVVDVLGEWDGETLTLTEDFVYEDGSTERRVWELTQTGEESWTGTAEGVIGTAEGEESGNAFNWRYTIDLDTPDGTLRASFEDWMWQLDDRVLVNRAYVTKWGIEIGQLSIFFRRAEPLGG